MLRSVMIPIDFSTEGRLLLFFAEGLPSLGVKRVVLGHVVEASGMEGPIIARTADKARDDIRALTPRLTDAGLEVEVRVTTGDPAHCLLALARETNVDVAVVGTHGKGIISKLFTGGSVSETIAVEAEVPTMLVRFDLLATRAEPASFARDFGKQVLLPVDFSESSKRALMAALELPKGALNMVYILHVLEAGLSGERLAKAEDEAEAAAGEMRAVADEKGVATRCVIRQGEPARVILQEANERRSTGVIVGTRGHNMLQEAMLGSTSLTLVRQASCPVMIVP